MANVSKRKAITVSLSKIVNIVLCKSLTFVNLITNIMGGDMCGSKLANLKYMKENDEVVNKI